MRIPSVRHQPGQTSKVDKQQCRENHSEDRVGFPSPKKPRNRGERQQVDDRCAGPDAGNVAGLRACTPAPSSRTSSGPDDATRIVSRRQPIADRAPRASVYISIIALSPVGHTGCRIFRDCRENHDCGQGQSQERKPPPHGALPAHDQQGTGGRGRHSERSNGFGDPESKDSGVDVNGWECQRGNCAQNRDHGDRCAGPLCYLPHFHRRTNDTRR